MKKLKSLVLASIIVISAILYFNQDDGRRPSIQYAPNLPYPTHFHKGERNPVVRLIDRDSGRGFCSGTVISDQYILTAGHCLFNEKHYLSKRVILVGTADGLVILGSSEAVGAGLSIDLGLVKGDYKGFAHPVVNDSNIEVLKSGLMTISFGYPMNTKYVVGTKINLMGSYMFMLAGQGILFPGMSGGPVFMTDGKSIVVVAVNTAVSGGAALFTPTISFYAMFGIEK
jgi:S1-C subfamily serine protease